MDKIIPFPEDNPDVREMMLDGKPEVMLSARGVMLFHLSSWIKDENEKATTASAAIASISPCTATRAERVLPWQNWIAWARTREQHG